VRAKPARIHRKASSLRYLYMRKKGGELADTLAKNLNELGNVGGTQAMTLANFVVSVMTMLQERDGAMLCAEMLAGGIRKVASQRGL